MAIEEQAMTVNALLVDRPVAGGAPVAVRPDCPAIRRSLIEAAKAMLPALKARAAQAEQLRRVPDETIDDFHRAGLFRMFQPFRVGGYELDPSIYMDVCAEIAKGCASSSWVLSNLAIHHQFMALWNAQAQEDVWSASPDTLIGSSYIFTAGKAERVAGGWRVSGRWPFSSGIDPCAWVVVGATAPGETAGASERHYFLLPRADYAILDTWHVVGLRGTGSKDLEAHDVFVPAHRSLSFAEATGGNAPGLTLNTAPLFKMSMQATGGLTLMATLYGSARGAVDDYVASIRARSGRVTGGGLADLPTVQIRVAEAEANLDTADMILRASWDRVMQALNTRGAIDPQDVVRLKRDAAWCARLCVAAVDAVFAGSGGGGLFESGAIQRHWRDVHAAAAQFGLQWDVWAPAYGRVRLGLASGVPGIGN
jgi:3-hydroxy-9,10-secoandrosta-1,3,5(10)-triene-9,17-dione monooxygenase